MDLVNRIQDGGQCMTITLSDDDIQTMVHCTSEMFDEIRRWLIDSGANLATVPAEDDPAVVRLLDRHVMLKTSNGKTRVRLALVRTPIGIIGGAVVPGVPPIIPQGDVDQRYVVVAHKGVYALGDPVDGSWWQAEVHDKIPYLRDDVHCTPESPFQDEACTRLIRNSFTGVRGHACHMQQAGQDGVANAVNIAQLERLICNAVDAVIGSEVVVDLTQVCAVLNTARALDLAESGKKRPKYTQCERIADWLDIHVETLRRIRKSEGRPLGTTISQILARINRTAGRHDTYEIVEDGDVPIIIDPERESMPILFDIAGISSAPEPVADDPVPYAMESDPVEPVQDGCSACSLYGCDVCSGFSPAHAQQDEVRSNEFRLSEDVSRWHDRSHTADIEPPAHDDARSFQSACSGDGANAAAVCVDPPLINDVDDVRGPRRATWMSRMFLIWISIITGINGTSVEQSGLSRVCLGRMNGNMFDSVIEDGVASVFNVSEHNAFVPCSIADHRRVGACGSDVGCLMYRPFVFVVQRDYPVGSVSLQGEGIDRPDEEQCSDARRQLSRRSTTFADDLRVLVNLQRWWLRCGQNVEGNLDVQQDHSPPFGTLPAFAIKALAAIRSGETFCWDELTRFAQEGARRAILYYPHAAEVVFSSLLATRAEHVPDGIWRAQVDIITGDVVPLSLRQRDGFLQLYEVSVNSVDAAHVVSKVAIFLTRQGRVDRVVAEGDWQYAQAHAQRGHHPHDPRCIVCCKARMRAAAHRRTGGLARCGILSVDLVALGTSGDMVLIGVHRGHTRRSKARGAKI